MVFHPLNLSIILQVNAITFVVQQEGRISLRLHVFCIIMGYVGYLAYVGYMCVCQIVVLPRFLFDARATSGLCILHCCL